MRHPPAHGNEYTLVFLHEGLGSIGLWRDFPSALCAVTGCAGIVYDRYGYGLSDAFAAPLSSGFLHREAQELLPRLMEQLDIRRPILVGHSDGASIALIYAGSVSTPEALVLEAPHTSVEDVTIAGLGELRKAYLDGSLRAQLARHHGVEVDRLFATWIDAWTSPEFRGWNIEEYLPRISCPILVIQGRDDEYGTLRQVSVIQNAVAHDVETLVLASCRHVPHTQQRSKVESAMAAFLKRVVTTKPARL